MPNWCSGFVEVRGNVRNVEKFCKLFLWEDLLDSKYYERHKNFARSFVHEDWKDFYEEHFQKVDDDDYIELELLVQFAWSGHSCLIDGYPQKNTKECLTLSSACKKYSVTVRIGTGEEGLGFEEKIFCDSEGNFIEECVDMEEVYCYCGIHQLRPSSRDLENFDCYECGECDKWKK